MDFEIEFLFAQKNKIYYNCFLHISNSKMLYFLDLGPNFVGSGPCQFTRYICKAKLFQEVMFFIIIFTYLK